MVVGPVLIYTTARYTESVGSRKDRFNCQNFKIITFCFTIFMQASDWRFERQLGEGLGNDNTGVRMPVFFQKKNNSLRLINTHLTELVEKYPFPKCDVLKMLLHFFLKKHKE